MSRHARWYDYEESRVRHKDHEHGPRPPREHGPDRGPQPPPPGPGGRPAFYGGRGYYYGAQDFGEMPEFTGGERYDRRADEIRARWEGERPKDRAERRGFGSGPHVGKGPKGYRRSDERIFESVCERLADHGGIDASDIEVKVAEGEVTLEGTVEDREAKRLAEDIAASCPGVEDVHNRLRVQRTAA